MKTLRKKIKNKSAKVVVIGLGYVGLPVACLLAKAGFSVVGINRGKEKVVQVNNGISPIKGDEPRLENLLKRVLKAKKLTATTDYLACEDADVVLIAVETPIDSNDKTPHYEALKSALKSLGKHLKKGALVIIESTIAPGTMEKIVKPTLEKVSGKETGKDFYLAYCPERVTPGRLLLQLENWPRVVGGMDEKTAQLAEFFYRQFLKGEVDATTSTTAEIVKTEENAFRDTMIAQANALALLCEHFGVDVYEVVELIKKDPGHTAYLYPGAGVGGHCLPKDGYLKISMVGQSSKNTRVKHSVALVKLAREINDFMPSHTLSLLEEGLKQSKTNKGKPKIAVLGYSYLANSDDTRNSPTESFLHKAKTKNFDIVVNDPFVEGFKSEIEFTLKDADALVLMVAHNQYKKLDLKKLKRLMNTPLIIDGRNVFDRKKAQDLGFVYKGIGNI